MPEENIIAIIPVREPQKITVTEIIVKAALDKYLYLPQKDVLRYF